VAENSIRSLCEFPEGTLWVGADNGLWNFDLDALEFREAGNESKKLKLVTALHPLEEKHLLIGEEKGLYRLSLPNGQPRKVHFPGAVTAIEQGNNRHFWIGAGDGLHLLEYQAEKDTLARLRHFPRQPGNAVGFDLGGINHLLFDKKNGALWICANNGLSRLETRPFETGSGHFPHQASFPHFLSENRVFQILEVEPGLMWAGTREGIHSFSSLPPKFFNLRNGDGLCSNSVLGMAEDDRDNLWVATKSGLTRIGHFSKKPSGWEIECLNTANTPSMPHDYALKVVNSGKEGLWILFRRNGFARLRSVPAAGGFLKKWIWMKS
jgi:ligand-binding sensor domain-containing protein